GDHDGSGPSSGIIRPHYRCRSSALVLGRCAREKPHALFGRIAGGQLADRVRKRPRTRQVRWRLVGAKFREPKSGHHTMEQAVQSLFEDRHGGTPLSRIREMVAVMSI